MTFLGKLAQYIAISKMRQLSLSLAKRLGGASWLIAYVIGGWLSPSQC
jgi:hypothetical protein